MSSGFRALRTRNYRLWISGALVSSIGTWMQRTAQDWLVLTILTKHSGLAVGITTGLQFAPLLLLSAHAGVLADRLPKRKVLMCTQSVMGASALTLGLLVVTHAVQLWEVFACALVLGLANAFDVPARQALASEVVAREDVTSAVSMNSASLNLARLIGPGLAGLVIAAYGTGPAFLINAFSFAAVLLGLARMRPEEMFTSGRLPRAPGQVREGFRYVRQRPDLMVIFLLTAMVNTFGLNFQITNALMASGTFHKGAREFGALGSVMAIGSLSAALLAGRREKPRLALVVGAAMCFGAVTLLASGAPNYYIYALALIPVGFCSITFLNSCNTAVQLSIDPLVRGRVIALYVIVQQGTTPIGAPIIGWIGTEFGARWSVAVGAIIAFAAGLATAAFLYRRPAIRHGFSQAIALREAVA
jgi:MFS family permease